MLIIFFWLFCSSQINKLWSYVGILCHKAANKLTTVFAKVITNACVFKLNSSFCRHIMNVKADFRVSLFLMQLCKISVYCWLTAAVEGIIVLQLWQYVGILNSRWQQPGLFSIFIYRLSGEYELFYEPKSVLINLKLLACAYAMFALRRNILSIFERKPSFAPFLEK